MFKKLMLAFAVLILIGVLITGLLSMEIVRVYYFKSVEDRLTTNAKLIQTALEQNTWKSEQQYEELCRRYGEITGGRVTIIGLDGNVLGDSDADAQDMVDHSDRPEVKQALEEGFGKSVRRSGTLDKEMLYVAFPLKDGRYYAGIIRVALPLDDISVIQQRIWYYIFLAIFVGISAALALSYRYLSTLIKPIGEMTEMASTIAGGKFNKRVQVKSGGEIGTLAATFNHMAEKMEKTVEELIKDKSKIEAILASSVNGVIAVDSSENIMFLNPVAGRMLDIQDRDFIGRPLFDIVCNKEAERILRNVLKAQRQTLEFELPWPKNRSIRVITAPIRPKVKHSRTIGTLIIIQDITTVKKLEKIRSDFVANVTHELKTPLTSIKGFIETLREGAAEDPDKRNRFLEIIDVETERLERLIEDILLLSEIESSSPHSTSTDQIDVRRIIKDEVLSIFANKAKQKSIDIETDFAAGLPRLNMSKDRFKQMLINLLDNAIKFTGEGGRVHVSASLKPDRIMVIKVKDNGIGIPKEHQGRIFERFYRVDRGRSRKEGGTGLGLAIVKHIVLLVNGSVEVDSRPGEGTEFTVEIPIR